jgi:hypothetical protein
MQQDKYQDMTWLLKVAEDHYLREPCRQIDLEFWNQAVDYPTPWRIQVGAHFIENVTLSTVPALAAISLGFSSAELLDVIKHHAMTTAEFFNLHCKKYGNGTQPEGRVVLSPWTVRTKFVDALCLDPLLTQSIIKDTKDNKVGNYTDLLEIEIARLLCNEEALWPITNLNAYAESKISGIKNLELPRPSITDLHTFLYCGSELSGLSNDQILLILERSGNLSMNMTAENGYSDRFSSGFFKTLFTELGENGYLNLHRIVQALNSVNDPDRLLALNVRLIAALSDFDYQDAEGYQTYNALEKELDKTRYAAVFDSPLIQLNLNLIPNKLFPKVHETPEWQLFDLLRHLEPSEFRTGHFKAIDKVFNDFIKSFNVINLDLNEYLIIVLRGFEAYSSTHGDRHDLVLAAVESVESLIEFVVSTTEIDYQRLNSLQSRAKCILVANGLDIKRLPGISNRDKGHLLNDQLGL